MLRIALLGAMALAFSSPSLAQSSMCVDSAGPKTAATAHGASWVTLTSEQRLFLVGIYVMNPQTPAGLPYGDKAALATVEGNPGGMVFFIDGDKACTPMPVPKEVIDMLREVALDTLHHAGDGL